MKSHTFFAGAKKGTKKFVVAFVDQWNMKRNILDSKADEEQIYVLGIKTDSKI